ncbi:MAG: hypothetical protein JXQ90_02780 [Cyclobacteriaceae bacterium]
MAKAVKFLWLFTVLLFLIILGFAYASLPIEVNLTSVKGEVVFHKETFFYYSISFYLVVNILVLGLFRMISPILESKLSEEGVIWVNLFSFCVNIYMTTVLGFIGVMNNPEGVPTANYNYLNYIGPILMIGWVIGLIYYLIKRK